MTNINESNVHSVNVTKVDRKKHKSRRRRRRIKEKRGRDVLNGIVTRNTDLREQSQASRDTMRRIC